MNDGNAILLIGDFLQPLNLKLRFLNTMYKGKIITYTLLTSRVEGEKNLFRVVHSEGNKALYFCLSTSKEDNIFCKTGYDIHRFLAIIVNFGRFYS